MTWVCVDCGYETDERWLMCPECTTPEDWAEVQAAVDAMTVQPHGQTNALEGK